MAGRPGLRRKGVRLQRRVHLGVHRPSAERHRPRPEGVRPLHRHARPSAHDFTDNGAPDLLARDAGGGSGGSTPTTGPTPTSSTARTGRSSAADGTPTT
ncbi:hypothetical protein ACFQ60_13630 [Streptomyces zhihengii]